jgi:hypothetical protein
MRRLIWTLFQQTNLKVEKKIGRLRARKNKRNKTLQSLSENKEASFASTFDREELTLDKTAIEY